MIRGTLRPPHRLVGVTISRSLFVATSPLILALLDERAISMKEAPRIIGSDKREDQPGYYLTGQVIAAYSSRERFQTVPYKGFRGAPSTGFRRLKLHLPACA
ncbi:MAG: hypothetical protein H6Q41_702 [Deltaproteobacteria bacterium]|nr:hypothetical protein [Deltaproteobacteria bacterium]